MTVNGYLQYVYARSQELLEELRQATIDIGGWEAALEASKVHRLELEAAEAAKAAEVAGSDYEGTPSISVTPAESNGSVTSTYVDASAANALRQRLTAVTRDAPTPQVEMSDFAAASSASPLKEKGIGISIGQERKV